MWNSQFFCLFPSCLFPPTWAPINLRVFISSCYLDFCKVGYIQLKTSTLFVCLFSSYIIVCFLYVHLYYFRKGFFEQYANIDFPLFKTWHTIQYFLTEELKLFLVENSEIPIFNISSVLEGKKNKKKSCVGLAKDLELA